MNARFETGTRGFTGGKPAHFAEPVSCDVIFRGDDTGSSWAVLALAAPLGPVGGVGASAVVAPSSGEASITIAPEHGAKHWQPRQFGSAEWQKIYFRLRNAVEGINGYAKNDVHEAIERAGRRRIRGIASVASPPRPSFWPSSWLVTPKGFINL